jgi:hypothetical protein
MNMCNVLYTFIAAEVQPLVLVQFIVYLKEFIISDWLVSVQIFSFNIRFNGVTS